MLVTTRRQLGCIVALAAILVVLSAMLACGDDSGTTDGTNESPSPATTDSTDGTPSSTGDGTAQPTEDAEDPTPTAALAGVEGELRDLIQNWLDGVNGKVTYRYLSDFGGHPDGVYTMYHLEGSHRHDWLNEGSGFGVTVTTIVDGEDAYVCTLSESSSICRSTTEEDAVQIRVAILIVFRTFNAIVDEIETMSVSELPGEEVADTEADCYEVVSSDRITEGPAGTETLKLCFSSRGQLLLIDHTVSFEGESLPDDNLLLEAQEVESASPSDFDPPAQLFGS